MSCTTWLVGHSSSNPVISNMKYDSTALGCSTSSPRAQAARVTWLPNMEFHTKATWAKAFLSQARWTTSLHAPKRSPCLTGTNPNSQLHYVTYSNIWSSTWEVQACTRSSLCLHNTEFAGCFEALLMSGTWHRINRIIRTDSFSRVFKVYSTEQLYLGLDSRSQDILSNTTITM